VGLPVADEQALVSTRTLAATLAAVVADERTAFDAMNEPGSRAFRRSDPVEALARRAAHHAYGEEGNVHAAALEFGDVEAIAEADRVFEDVFLRGQHHLRSSSTQAAA
jgi:uncharacterized protein with PIN domain